MAWIESHEEIADHRKTGFLSQQLGCTVPTAVGYVHLLWHYTLKVAWKDGDLSDFIPPVIERACWFDGKIGELVKAFQDSGFLDGMKVHDWNEYAKYIIYQRLYNEKRRKNNSDFPTKKEDSTVPTHVPTLKTQLLPVPNHTNTYTYVPFDSFWKLYPRKESKQSAIKAWAKLHPDTSLFKLISRAVADQINSEQWKKGFIPHASTWLNGKRWEDEVKQADQKERVIVL